MKIIKLLDEIGISEEYYETYGKNKAKINASYLENLQNKKDGKLILVTAITPTNSGEGKTTVSIGLADALKKLNQNVVLALREPSLGPVFGLKGGAIGGGKSSLYPEVDINLHFTGDFHALTTANNLLSALIDAHIFHGNSLKIKEVVFKRTLDINDRSLREIETPLRKDGFNITAASEIMAIMSLANNLKDLKQRLGNILIGFNEEEQPIYARQLNCIDSLTILLKDALNPNLVRTLEGTPAIVHMGPFANVATGCNSLIATKLALKLGNYCVTEAGFGSDLGAEKFLDIKTRLLPKHPDVVVIVATIRALKSHGGVQDDLTDLENVKALEKGIPNLEKHIENIANMGLNYLVVLNKFESDSNKEIDVFMKWAEKNGHQASISTAFIDGGEGALDAARKVMDLSSKENNFKFNYSLEDSIIDKIKTIAKKVYGAVDVDFSKKALRKIESFNKHGWDNLPICIAKTPLSLSGDSKLKGRPSDFILSISDVRVSLGAGFIVALTKGIVTMPGLGSHPLAYDMSIDNNGNIKLTGDKK
ncbi:formate--tetrahydrofolate ligase [Acholeplasma sp. OttesenSCG-928-E16]|nr:formate--tetrahydrofolate ligase [Acholeplasma sp. OttesenSCG-928-E16]